MSLVRLDPEKCQRGKRELNPGSAAQGADALTSRPARRSVLEICPVSLHVHRAVHLCRRQIAWCAPHCVVVLSRLALTGAAK